MSGEKRNILINHHPIYNQTNISKTSTVKSMKAPPQIIVRTFELPARKLQSHNQQIEICKFKERWKYQHDVPEISGEGNRIHLQKEATKLEHPGQAIKRYISNNGLKQKCIESPLGKPSNVSNASVKNVVSSNRVCDNAAAPASIISGTTVHLLPVTSDNLKEFGNQALLNSKFTLLPKESFKILPPEHLVTLQELTNSKCVDTRVQNNQTFKNIAVSKSLLKSLKPIPDRDSSDKQTVNPFVPSVFSNRSDNVQSLDNNEECRVISSEAKERNLSVNKNKDYQTIHVEIVAKESNCLKEGQEKCVQNFKSVNLGPVPTLVQNRSTISPSSLPTNVKLIKSPHSQYKKVILKQTENGLHIVLPKGSESCPVTAVPPGFQETLHAKALLQYRQDIALKYQQDLQRMKELPRFVRKINIKERTVEVADAVCQTSLFSLVEAGRMIEMTETNSKSAAEYSKVANKKSSLVPSSTTREQNIKTNSDGPESKRLRLDSAQIDANRKENQRENMEKDLYMEIDDLPTVHKDVPTILQSSALDTSLIRQNELSLQIPNSYVTPVTRDSQVCYTNINMAPFSNIQGNINSADVNMNEVSYERQQNESNMVILQNNNLLQTAYEEFSKCLKANDIGNMPIHDAVMDGNFQIVKRQCLVLKACGKSVDIQNQEGKTPLHLAVINEYVDIVKELLKYGSNPAVLDDEGNTALHLAIYNCFESKCFETILETVQRNAPLLNQDNDEGFSPLHLCALYGKEQEASALIKKGADINLKDKKSGRTALFHAVEKGKESMFRMLVNEFGASTTVPNFSGQTPSTACENSTLYNIQFEGHIEKEKITADSINNTLENSSENLNIIQYPSTFQEPLFMNDRNNERTRGSCTIIYNSQSIPEIMKDR